MAPFYQKPIDYYGRYMMPKLQNEDIKAIKELYSKIKLKFF